MKKILVLLLLVPSVVFADVTVVKQVSTGRILEMQSDPRPHTLIDNAISAGFIESDLIEVKITEQEFKQEMQDARWRGDISTLKGMRLTEIRQEAKGVLQSMTGYALGNATQRTNIQAALRQAYLDAKASITACADIACVRAVQPAWPADPGE